MVSNIYLLVAVVSAARAAASKGGRERPAKLLSKLAARPLRAGGGRGAPIS